MTDVDSPTVMITVAVLTLGCWAWRRDRARAVLGCAGLVAVVVVEVAWPHDTPGGYRAKS